MAKIEDGNKTIHLSELEQDRRNANKGSQRGQAMLETSFRQYGAGRSILIDKKGRIIAGNKSAEQAMNIGMEDVIVVQTDGTKLVAVQRTDLDLYEDDAARQLAYSDNRTSEVSLTWDAGELFADLQSGVDLSGVFTQDELDAMLAGLVAPEPVEDVAPDISKADELQKKWSTQIGQIWQLGKHKIACGSSTDIETVKRLMQDEKAEACVTDPPFNVRGDDWDKFEDFLGFTRMWLSNAKLFSPVIAAFFADKFLPLLPKAAELEGIPFRRSLIWVKPPGSQFAGGQKDGFWFDFELIQVYGEPVVEPPKSPKFSVFDYRTITGQEHGAEKPTGLYSDIFINYTTDGGIVYEPFSGTGSNLMACEISNRRCRAIELSPSFVAVTLERFNVATNILPVLID